MKKSIIAATLIAAPIALSAQTAIDAYSLSRYTLKGTARYVSMGGAFGALGGDLSTLAQNPAGLGVYRKSDIGVTLDIDINSTESRSSLVSVKDSHTHVSVPNFAYAGSLYTESDVMPYFNWGIGINRVASFNRRFRGASAMTASLSNYIAGYTTSEMWGSEYLEGSDQNYFSAQGAPWMSILAYNSYLINPTSYGSTSYQGLWGNGTVGENEFDVHESGYVDEYNINFGGNFADVVYWGVGLGITDIEFKQNVYYEEFLQNAQIPVVNPEGHIVAGHPTVTDQEVGFGLESAKHISGTGYNFKAGLIIRPVNALRLGFAVHTPTYYKLNQANYGIIDYGYGYNTDPLKPGYTESPIQYSDWKLRTPWRLMGSIAGIISDKAIISADYEYRPYQDASTRDADGYQYQDVNADIKSTLRSVNILRVGAEYRLSSHVSLRAGYAYESSPLEKKDEIGQEQFIVTSTPNDTGTMPSYTLDNSTRYITCGLGYRYKGFYADAAYVNRRRTSAFHPFTPNDYTLTQPATALTSTSDNIVLTVGIKF